MLLAAICLRVQFQVQMNDNLCKGPLRQNEDVFK
jgi:hypothetical protein